MIPTALPSWSWLMIFALCMLGLNLTGIAVVLVLGLLGY